MANDFQKQPGDDALGMNERISRRDYLNSTLLASGSALLGGLCPMDLLGQEDWNGFSGIGEYKGNNGNTHEVMDDGHKIRDHVFDPLPKIADSSEEYDCVVVGGGISGISAALFFQRYAAPNKTCLVLDDHGFFGGLCKQNEFLVGETHVIAHQASAMFFPPLEDTFHADFYRSIGITQWEFPYQKWAGSQPEMPLQQTAYFAGGPDSGLYFGPKFGRPEGFWLVDPWSKKLAGAPISEQARRELMKMHTPGAGSNYPKPKIHGDAVSRHLDSITLEEDLMQRYGLSRDTVRQFLSRISGNGSGIGPDVLSAYADYAADVFFPWDYAKGAQMFPGGNTGVVRHVVKALLPDAIPGPVTASNICGTPVNVAVLDRPGQRSRIRLRATTVFVKHEGDPEKSKYVRIVYFKDGALHSIRARSVVYAGGSWTARRVVKDLSERHRQAYAQFYRAPAMMANVALTNWRFLYKMGISDCQWFEGIGYSATIRKLATFGPVSPTISPDSPVVLSLKILFSHPGLTMGEQVMRGRGELYSTSYREYERKIREQLTAMFSKEGFDARKDIAGLILNRWGHAYLCAQPGFFFGKDGQPAPGEVLRNNPSGRIAFANSDVTGIMDHRASIQEANRAVRQILPFTS